MTTEFKNLITKFKEINKRKYIKGINNNLINSAGLTFENLLGKKADSMFFPDYEGIEIKCTQRYSHYPIGLFSLAFEGPELFETSQILKKYGYRDYIFFGYKKLIGTLKYNEKVLIGRRYFELNIDENNKRIFLNIYNKNNKLLDTRGFIDFNTIKERLETKLSNFCLIYASKKKDNNDLYFRYYKIECYILKDFNTFLNLIKTNEITITIMLRFSRNYNTLGKNKNKGLLFAIDKEKVDKLFNKIYSYEN